MRPRTPGGSEPAKRTLAHDYVELRCRSAFSFLEGASNPEDLAQQAGHQAVIRGSVSTVGPHAQLGHPLRVLVTGVLRLVLLLGAYSHARGHSGSTA